MKDYRVFLVLSSETAENFPEDTFSFSASNTTVFDIHSETVEERGDALGD